MMTNRVVMAFLMRRATAMRIPSSSSSNSRCSSNYICPLRTFQSLSDAETLTRGNKCLFSNGNINSAYTNFSSSSSTNKRSFGSDSDSGLSSQKNIQRLKVLRNDLEMWSSRSTHDAPDRATTILQLIFRSHNDEVNVRDCNQVISTWNKARNRNDAAGQALDILEHMIDVYDEHGNDSVRPTVATYNLVNDTFARKGDIENSCMVFTMQSSDFEMRQNVKAKPDMNTFHSLIYACSNSRAKNAAEISKGILATLIDWHEKGKLKEGPNARVLITVMNACARNGDVDGATSILRMMENDVYEVPYVRVYSILINAWSKSGRDDAASQARYLLEKINNMYSSGHIQERPDTIMYCSVIDAYAARGNVQGSMDVLEMMEKDFESGNDNAKTNMRTYSTLINAWAKSGKDDAPSQAEHVLKKMIDLHYNGHLEEGPNTTTYNTVMNTYAARGDAEGASDILEMMEKDFKSGNNNAKPDIMTYNTLLSTWSKSSDDNAPCQAMNLLNTIIDLYSKGDIEEGPNVITYNTMMNAYAARGDPQGASDILEMMEDAFNSGNKNANPNMRSYSTLINAWSKSKKADSPEQARIILQKLIDMHSSGYLNEGPNKITYSAVMNAYAARGDPQGASDILEMMEKDFKSGNNNAGPNLMTYNTLINAWSKSSDDDAPRQAMNLLNKTIDLYSKGDLEEGPNTTTYNTVINTYAACGDAEGACSILDMMEDDFNSGNSAAKSDTRTYNILIHAWCKSGKDNAPHKARNLLEKVIRMYSKGNIEVGPDTITYGAVMAAYAEQGDIQGASDLHQMLKNAFKSCNKKTQPNTQTYNILIKAWSKSSKDNAAEEVEKILQEINDLHKSGYLKEGPTIVTYKSMIRCLNRIQGTENRIRELVALMNSI